MAGSRIDFTKAVNGQSGLTGAQSLLPGLSAMCDRLLALVTTGNKCTGFIQELPLPLAHLDQVNGMFGSVLMDRLTATDCINGDSGLELRAVGAALVHRWVPLSGHYPVLEVKDGTYPENQSTSHGMCWQLLELRALKLNILLIEGKGYVFGASP